jgi:sugar/nucleoside kinase (ribokinase family)
MDILIHEDDAFLAQTGAEKGVMTYADESMIGRVLQRAASPAKVVPGGSACNTMVGICRLGGEAHFIGKCGDDEMGLQLRSSLEEKQVCPELISSQTPTGRVLSIVTPDAQRSMLTFLGASAETHPKEIPADSFNDAAIVHVEGYLLFNQDLITAVLARAKASDALVSLDLASANVVEASKEPLAKLIDQYVDILIANEDEALAYTGIEDEVSSVREMARQARLAVLKTGPRGSLIAHEDQVVAIESKGDGRAKDTTGAGDLWAAGFLYGLIEGMPLDCCGDLGSLCGFEVCQVMGATIPDVRWQVIHQYMEEKWPKKR